MLLFHLYASQGGQEEGVISSWHNIIFSDISGSSQKIKYLHNYFSMIFSFTCMYLFVNEQKMPGFCGFTLDLEVVREMT